MYKSLNIKKIWFPPSFISIFPILHLYSENISKVNALTVLQLLVVVFGVSCALLVMTKTLFKSWVLASVLISGYWIIFSSYGHIEPLITDGWVSGILAKRPTILFIYIFLCVLLLFLCFRANELTLLNICEVIFNACFALLFLFIINLSLNLGGSVANSSSNNSETQGYQQYESIEKSEKKPNVYLIIVDSYGSPAILDRLYRFHDPLPSDLKERGFHVAENKFSNYDNTLPSMSSILNMKYINDVYMMGASENVKYERQKELINNSEVAKVFKGMGYKVHFVNSPTTEKSYNFISSYLSTTILKPLQKSRHYYQSILDSIEMFNKTIDLTDSAYSNLVYYHLDVPHAPFVFDSNCDYSSRKFFESSFGAEGYINQVKCARKFLLSIIDRLIELDNGRSIILVTSDHGPPLGVAGNPIGETGDRLGILSAVYSKGCQDKNIINDVSPVNYFKKILIECFSKKLEYVPDKYHTILWSKDRNLTDISNEISLKIKVLPSVRGRDKN